MLRRWAAILALLAFVTPGAHADAVADFYRGRTITLVVGYGPGGGYDLCARLVARHMGRYIPGNPTRAVQNMPAARTLRAAHPLYTAAPNDGATICTIAPDLPPSALLATI